MNEVLKLVWDSEQDKFRLYGPEGEKTIPDVSMEGRRCKVAECIAQILGCHAIRNACQDSYTLLPKGATLKVSVDDDGEIRAVRVEV